MHDTGDRRQRRAEERFRCVVEAAPNAMVMVNGRGLIEMVNTQAERLFGYNRSEMLGQSVEMLVPERFRARHPEQRSSFWSCPRSRPMGAGRDLYGRRKDGSEVPVEIGINPIETEGEMMVLSAIVDISDRKHKESRIEAALREKELLLGEIHHRVKNNLQIVSSLLDLQFDRIDDPAIRDMLTDTKNRVAAMALIHQILYESKNFAEIDLGDFIQVLAPALMAAYCVHADQVRLKIDAGQVHLPINAAVPCGLLVNELITNALKHAFPDGREGEVEVGLSCRNGEEITLVVSDDGIGLPADLDPRQPASMGLSLIALLTQQLLGELDVGRGAPTRFSIRFPLTAA